MAPQTESIYSKYFYPVGFAAIGFGTPGVKNRYNRRPWYAGIQKHITYGIIGFVLGYYVEQYYRRKWMERDAMVRHYIELHPEDFEEKKRKYKEVFDEWCPIR